MTSRPQSTTANRVGPLRPTACARRVLRPAGWSRIAGGFWGERRRSPHRGSCPVLDTDVYKWLEAAAWQAADEDGGADSTAESESEHSSDDAAARINAMVALIAAAQQPDGYLNSWFQVVKRGERYTDLRCVCGHPEVETALVELYREPASRVTSPSPGISSIAVATA